MATLALPVRPRTPSSHSHSGPFINEPFFDFRLEETARKMRAAIERVRGRLGHEYDLVIGGERIKTADKIKSLNPSRPSQIVGIHQKAGREHVEPAMSAALHAFESWKHTSVEERAGLLFRAADLLRGRKMDYMAWLVFEVSKNWGEADADISETIDFCEFYAREALRFAKAETPVQMPGERD
jgi:1-pyrroline-5-carboxylate dehydrogenase